MLSITYPQVVNSAPPRGMKMPIEEEPIVGAVYEDADGVTFEVIAFDEDEGAIEVRYEDGTVGEMDIDNWYETDLHRLHSDKAEEGDEEEGDEDLDDEDDEEEENYDEDDEQ